MVLECYGSKEELAQTRKKLNTLKSLLSAKLTNQAIMEYDVQWTDNGKYVKLENS